MWPRISPAVRNGILQDFCSLNTASAPSTARRVRFAPASHLPTTLALGGTGMQVLRRAVGDSKSPKMGAGATARFLIAARPPGAVLSGRGSNLSEAFAGTKRPGVSGASRLGCRRTRRRLERTSVGSSRNNHAEMKGNTNSAFQRCPNKGTRKAKGNPRSRTKTPVLTLRARRRKAKSAALLVLRAKLEARQQARLRKIRLLPKSRPAVQGLRRSGRTTNHQATTFLFAPTSAPPAHYVPPTKTAPPPRPPPTSTHQAAKTKASKTTLHAFLRSSRLGLIPDSFYHGSLKQRSHRSMLCNAELDIRYTFPKLPWDNADEILRRISKKEKSQKKRHPALATWTDHLNAVRRWPNQYLKLGRSEAAKHLQVLEASEQWEPVKQVGCRRVLEHFEVFGDAQCLSEYRAERNRPGVKELGVGREWEISPSEARMLAGSESGRGGR